MIQIICVNGFPESGKTTFEKECVRLLGKRGSMVSTIDFIKQIAILSGWDGTKNKETRQFLHDLKELLSNAPWGNVPLQEVLKHCKSINAAMGDKAETHYVFVDVREPKYLQQFKDLGALTVLIRRPGDEKYITEQYNEGDVNVLDFEYDYVINNDGAVMTLYQKAKQFLTDISTAN